MRPIRLLLACVVAAADASVHCAGPLPPDGRLEPPDGLRASQLFLGRNASCAIERDSSLVKCWGSQEFGQAANLDGTHIQGAGGPNHICTIQQRIEGEASLRLFQDHLDGVQALQEAGSQFDAVFSNAAAHASATSLFGPSLPATVAQPVFVTKSRWSYDDASALSSTIFFTAAPSALDCATQIGTSAVVTAVSACTFATRAVVPLVVHPP